ncbi:Vms1/Ankzf1 family peptidyl-tRNA hydrolase [Halosimplex amylolyticum]|uniref:Vms1/Ankzf1 family peptidyl-tRNA hydrolase n=1 Tax=Halosimplex amylolyticum TaxID=3396616 RepID=UPI003F558641
MTTAYELADRIEELSAIDAGGDRLLTVAVPPDESVGAALERVEEAHADAEYLHPEETDEAARSTLEQARHLLHRYEETGTPENGLVLYVGTVDGETREWIFDDLPTPVPEAVHQLDRSFDTAPLERTTGDDRTYGLLVVERGGAVLGRLDGDAVAPVESIESEVMGKTRAGGQSAQRFARERERQKEEFFDEVAAETEWAFLADAGATDGGAVGDATDDADTDALAVDGLLVGGTTVTVDDFLEGDHLDYRLEDAIVGGHYAVEYAGEQGLDQLVDRASDELDAAAERPAREALDDFFDALGADEPVVYGPEETAEALDYGAVETMLCSAALPAEAIREWEARTDEEGGETVVVPDGFDRGARFREAFGGVGALLRFPLE